MVKENNVALIREIIGDAAVCEQLAEECAELAHASLKMARILRNENPTPLSEDQVYEQMSDEFTDVILCALDFGLCLDYKQLLSKDKRWRTRIKNMVNEAYGNEDK